MKLDISRTTIDHRHIYQHYNHQALKHDCHLFRSSDEPSGGPGEDSLAGLRVHGLPNISSSRYIQNVYFGIMYIWANLVWPNIYSSRYIYIYSDEIFCVDCTLYISCGLFIITFSLCTLNCVLPCLMWVCGILFVVASDWLYQLEVKQPGRCKKIQGSKKITLTEEEKSRTN